MRKQYRADSMWDFKLENPPTRMLRPNSRNSGNAWNNSLSVAYVIAMSAQGVSAWMFSREGMRWKKELFQTQSAAGRESWL